MQSISSVVIPGLMAACALSRMVRAMWHALRVPSICFAVLMGTALPHASQSQSLNHLTGTPVQPGWLHMLKMEGEHQDLLEHEVRTYLQKLCMGLRFAAISIDATCCFFAQ